VDSFSSRTPLATGGPYGPLDVFKVDVVPGARSLPFALTVMLENLLRHEDGISVTADHVRGLADGSLRGGRGAVEFAPSRVFLHDTNGVPVLTDIAALRDAVVARGGTAASVDAVVPAHLTVDHSVVTDVWGSPDAPSRNVALEYQRNTERYRFLKWGQSQLAGLQVVPPGAGIMHQINLERLASVVEVRDGQAFPDTVAGTDSHTTMINGLGVLAWGVGGIEASAALLGQPVTLLVPPVVGVELVGVLAPGVTATDLVLTIAEVLRAHGVVSKFVEFFGPGVSAVPLADRATIANMSPEYGSTCAVFPVDEVTCDYLTFTGRAPAHVRLVEQYCRLQGLWHDPSRHADYDERLRLDLGEVRPSIAGPRRPQDRIPLEQARARFHAELDALRPGRRALDEVADTAGAPPLPASDPPATPTTTTTTTSTSRTGTTVETTPSNGEVAKQVAQEPASASVVASADHGAVAIASITSCTNTSNPAVMVAAGLLARNARARGLATKPWVKTSLAPGSKVVTDYLHRAGLDEHLDALGFSLVGYGCMTCIGNSGPLVPELAAQHGEQDLVLASVLSGNRNFDSRIHNDVSLNYLASPPLVVAYALAGTLDHDLVHEPLGIGTDGGEVYLADVWPDDSEVAAVVQANLEPSMFTRSYATIFDGDQRWSALDAPSGDTFGWDPTSTYVRRPPFLDDVPDRARPPHDITGARALGFYGDSVTTDHICPAGRIPATSEAGRHLTGRGVPVRDLNTYASRRGNYEVMLRAGFANPRLVNQLVLDGTGGATRDLLDPDALTSVAVHEAARRYRAANVPLVVLGGREYGTGSSRDWAAKVTALLGVRAVIAASFERIHRQNLVGTGVLPLQFLPGQDATSLGLDGTEVFDIEGLSDGASTTESTDSAAAPIGVPLPERLQVTARSADPASARPPVHFWVLVRVDTPVEAAYYRAGGILPFVLRRVLAREPATSST